MLSSFFVSAFLLDLASAHGRLTVPTTRLGNPALYENNPVQYPLKEFVCRNDKNSAVTPPVYTAGQVIQITYLTSAPHVGDAAVYISYDGDEGFATRETMQFFKIANIPRAKDSSETPISITLPAWLPGGQAVLRWEWYALHVNPNIELYAHCSDVVIMGSDAEVSLDIVPKYHVVDQSTYDPKTLPKVNQGDIWAEPISLYRNAFDTDNYPQFMTGPECALGFSKNDCSMTAHGTKGHIDVWHLHQEDNPDAFAEYQRPTLPTLSPAVKAGILSAIALFFLYCCAPWSMCRKRSKDSFKSSYKELPTLDNLASESQRFFNMDHDTLRERHTTPRSCRTPALTRRRSSIRRRSVQGSLPGLSNDASFGRHLISTALSSHSSSTPRSPNLVFSIN